MMDEEMQSLKVKRNFLLLWMVISFLKGLPFFFSFFKRVKTGKLLSTYFVSFKFISLKKKKKAFCLFDMCTLLLFSSSLTFSLTLQLLEDLIMVYMLKNGHLLSRSVSKSCC